MKRLTHQGEHGPYWDKTVFDKHGGMEEDLIIDRLAYYEDMEEQGRLVVLPCKVGDKLYRNAFICNAPVDGTRCDEYDNCDDCPYSENEIVSWECPSKVYILQNLDNFGKKFFLTREEAEQALKGGAEE